MPVSRHQKEGSRIPGVSPRTQWREIGLKRRQRAFQRASQALDRAASALGHSMALLIVAKPAADAGRELARVIDFRGAAGAVEGRIDVGKIPHMRTMQDSRAQLNRLDR